MNKPKIQRSGMIRTPVMIMAGGRGSRLGPLTCHRAKPAVPFGGRYRIIDFVLSNFLNSGYRKIFLLTQFMASSLIRHVTRNWQHAGFFLEIVPAQMRKGEFWYRGTADSIYQNLNLIDEVHARNVAVFGGDHIYKFSIDQMEAAHDDSGADLTVAAFPVPKAEACSFGVIQVDERGRVKAFQEKPSDPKPIPGRPGWCLVSMGNYIFQRSALCEVLQEDAASTSSRHDFGKDVIPKMVSDGRSVYAYDFGENLVPGEPLGASPYWRDVGTIEGYFQSNMDLRSPLPTVNLYNRDWRIRTAIRHYPPARFVRHGRSGTSADVVDSLVCEGSIVSSALLHEVLVGYDCFIQAGSVLEDCLLLSGCDIGAGARVRRVLFDKNCSIDPGVVIGEDPEEDRSRFPYITESGIVLLPKGTHVPRRGPICFARDTEPLLNNDLSTRAALEQFAGQYAVGEHQRSSHQSAGPRYQRYGPAALARGDSTQV